MQQRVFSSQIEDTQDTASNQTGGDNENSNEDEGPEDRCCWAPRARKQAAMMPAAKTNNIYPHWRTMLILFTIPLLLKKQREFLERGANSKIICFGTVQIPARMISMVSFVMSYRTWTSRRSFHSEFVCIPIASNAKCKATGFFAGSGLQRKALSSALLSSTHW